MKKRISLLCALTVMVTSLNGAVVVRADEIKEDENVQIKEINRVMDDAQNGEVQNETVNTENASETTQPSENNMGTETTEVTETTENIENPEPELAKFEALVSGYNFDDGTIDISWAMFEGAAQYSVYVKSQEEWIELSSGTELQTTVDVAEYGIQCVYKVVAENAEENPVAESQEIDVVFPGKITGITTTSLTDKKVKLEWNTSLGAVKYIVYVKNPSGSYKLYKETDKSKLNMTVASNKKYSYKVIPVSETSSGSFKGKAKTVTFDNTSDFVSMNHQRYTYDEMVSDMKSLAAKYNDYVYYEKIGESEFGRNIYDIVIGNPDAKKTLLVVCELHAREYVTSVMAMKQIEYYLKNYNKTIDGVKVADVFEECCVHYVVMANPDGATIAQTKNARWKANGKGVNLNNNFNYRFKSFGSAKYGTYSGSKAGSAKESKAIIAITKKLMKKKHFAVVNYHAMGSIVFGSYTGKNKTVKNVTKKMYNIARSTTGYADAGGYDSKGNGNYREYLIYTLKIPSVTLEVGTTPCPVSQVYYSNIFNRNKLVILREAQIFN